MLDGDFLVQLTEGQDADGEVYGVWACSEARDQVVPGLADCVSA